MTEYALFEGCDLIESDLTLEQAREQARRLEAEIPQWVILSEDTDEEQPAFTIPNRPEKLETRYNIVATDWEREERWICTDVPASQIRPRHVKGAIVLTFLQPDGRLLEVITIEPVQESP